MFLFKVYAIIDLLLSLAIGAYPWFFFERPYGTETAVPEVVGLTQVSYSLLSKYELGICKYVNFKSHLSLDFLVGLMVLTGLWIWGFRPKVM